MQKHPENLNEQRKIYNDQTMSIYLSCDIISEKKKKKKKKVNHGQMEGNLRHFKL